MPKRYWLAADVVQHMTREWARDLAVANNNEPLAYRRPFIDVIKRPNHWRETYGLSPIFKPEELGLWNHLVP